LIEEAKAAAGAFQEKQMLQARQDAEAIVAKARDEARRDYDRMLAELKSEVARLVVDTTARVSGKVLTSEDQKRLTEEANREIAA
jgi:F-type H+-transporting ATPase subunit b